MKLKNRLDYIRRRHLRLRKNISGTAACPRLCVSVTNQHMYVQFVDDDAAVTLAAVTTLKKGAKIKNNIAAAQELGRRAAEAAKQKGIASVVFDRGGHSYNGRVKAIAEAVRAAGIKL